MDKTILPGRVKGTLMPPCSKSYAQRALAAALLCEGVSQLRNIERVLTYPIMDRSELILRIFERRAKTKEAKMQVSHQHFGKGIRRNRYPSRP